MLAGSPFTPTKTVVSLLLWLALLSCSPSPAPSVLPNEPMRRVDADAGAQREPTTTTPAVAQLKEPVPSSMITHGIRAAEWSKEPPPPAAAPVCASKETRGRLSFEHVPTYSERVERDGTFTARLFIANDGACSRRVAIPLSFTPPKKTTTKTIDFAAYVPPHGALVDLELTASELTQASVTAGRYAVTFAVLDEDAQPVGRAFSGNPLRIGRDDVVLTAAPTLPRRIGLGEDLVVPFSIANTGDTANRVTPLVVFTRPGETIGIEHYDPPTLVVPGASSFEVRLTPATREKENIRSGSWLVTVTMFDSAGDRLSSFAGIPLAIGNIDLRMERPELPTRVGETDVLRARFTFDNRGDTADKITAVVAFTRPGTSQSHELTFTREVGVGKTTFDATIEPAERSSRNIGKGVWLVTTAAFRSSGERIKSFTGHYLEITR